MKNRLSAYSIAILVGLSLTTTAVVIHNPFSPHAAAATHLGGASTNMPTPALGQNSTSLLTHTPVTQQSHYESGDDGGYGGSNSSYNGTRTDT